MSFVGKCQSKELFHILISKYYKNSFSIPIEEIPFQDFFECPSCKFVVNSFADWEAHIEFKHGKDNSQNELLKYDDVIINIASNGRK